MEEITHSGAAGADEVLPRALSSPLPKLPKSSRFSRSCVPVRAAYRGFFPCKCHCKLSIFADLQSRVQSSVSFASGKFVFFALILVTFFLQWVPHPGAFPTLGHLGPVWRATGHLAPPIFIYVVVQSQLPHPLATVSFLNTFRCPEQVRSLWPPHCLAPPPTCTATNQKEATGQSACRAQLRGWALRSSDRTG